MELNEYRLQTTKTAIYPGAKVEEIDTNHVTQGLVYTTLGLVGEAGEFANKVKKLLRDKNRKIDLEAYEALTHELGDILWYVAQCSRHLGADLDWIAESNLKMLGIRMEQGKIQGSGDQR